MAGPPWLAWLAPLAWPLVLTAPLPWPLVETPTPLLATPLAALGVSKGRSCSMASWKFVEEIFHKAVKLRNFWNPQLTPFFQIGSIYDVYRENNNDYQVIGQVAKKNEKQIWLGTKIHFKIYEFSNNFPSYLGSFFRWANFLANVWWKNSAPSHQFYPQKFHEWWTHIFNAEIYFPNHYFWYTPTWKFNGSNTLNSHILFIKWPKTCCSWCL